MHKRLTIVVPYRDREAHLGKFVPHLLTYFARDKIDCALPYRVVFVEQAPGKPFNRGALKNIGFLLARDHCDYVCFHDVDYLPVWADYSYTPIPSCILWYGAEARPIDSARTTKRVRNDLENCFGGVVLIDNAQFAAVNGYSNDYWGWGFEDTDIIRRFAAKGIQLGRRKGTFTPLDHVNEGFDLEAAPSPIHAANRAVFLSKWASAEPDFAADGLSSVRWEMVGYKRFDNSMAERPAPYEMVTVEIQEPAPPATIP